MDINLFIVLGVILIALVVEFMVEAIKTPIAAVIKVASIEDKVNPVLAPFLSIIFSIMLCILTGCDLFVAFGYPLSEPYIGCAASGLVASLGAGKVYDLVMSYRDYRDKIAIEKKED